MKNTSNIGPQETANNFDVIIVGAGVAGCTLASMFGRMGIRTALIERDLDEPDRIVGELLQPSGVQMLRDMGLETVLEGFDAQPVSGYAIFNQKEHFSVSYPLLEGNNSEKQGKDSLATGRGFRYGKFITRLREEVKKHSSVEIIEGNVKDFVWEKNAVSGKNKAAEKRISGVEFLPKNSLDSQNLKARLTVVCDGCFSRLRKTLNRAEPMVAGYFLGLVLENAGLPCPGHGHVFISEHAPFLSYPISSTETRVLIDFPGNTPPPKGEELQSYLRTRILPQMPESMHLSFINAIESGKFKSMPNSILPADPEPVAGVVMVGDSLNMRHPLTGGGMTVALTDVKALNHRLATLLVASFSPENQLAIESEISQYYDNRHKQNATINILAYALYRVFKHPDLSDACFEYLKSGGSRSEEPISIISGISRDLDLLVKHFIAVARFGAVGLLRRMPTFAGLKRSHQMFSDALAIITPLILDEKPPFGTRFALSAAKIVFPIRNKS